ncbi:MAG: type I methionyl aminopeptidase [Actinomycetota bacterium]
MNVSYAPAPTLRSNDPCWCGSGKKYKRCHKLSDMPITPGAIGPPRRVPEDIPRPEYADGSEPGPPPSSEIQDLDVIERMRVAGRAAAEVLAVACRAVAPGVTTDEIDALVHEETIKRGGYPSTLGYRGYPKSCCTSVNEVICHGIPDSRALLNGDIVNIDVTVFLDGVHGDVDATVPVGVVDPASLQLIEVTRRCLYEGIGAVRPGRPISDIGRAIETLATRHGYGIVRSFTGHGIGERFHTGLQIPHFYNRRATRIMEPGMIFTVEPMITMGTWEHEIWDDSWTAVTADGGRTAQFEHTLVVTEYGSEILTEL